MAGRPVIGTRLGPYEIQAELGAGGMGRVYRAEVTRKVSGLDAGCAVALKVIHPHMLKTEGFFRRFLREADIGRSVQHENVVRTHLADALIHEGVQQNFLVMEYVEGQTLRELLQELGRVPEELCRHIGRELATGVAAIHAAGVMHRDLKPENVLITAEHAVKIMDLGVARLRDESIRLSQTGAFVGSLEYAAPEQFESATGEPDGRADLHALGVLLYELATGRHPYRSDGASGVLRNILEVVPAKAGTLSPQLSPFFEEVLHTLLAKRREDRFESASELAGILAEGEGGTWWRARASALRRDTRRPLRRIRIPRETAVYGRDKELDRLQGLYARIQAGDGRVLLLDGEAGIGKSRLVDEFVRRLQRSGEDLNFLHGSYPPGGAATASGAFSTAYREQLGAEDLERTLARYLTVTPVLIPSFAALLRGEGAPWDARRLTKDSLQTVFTHVTQALAAERPTIVWIDDLHFAPQEGRALFASLALAVPGHRILLIGTMRPDVPEDWIASVERQEHASRVRLARLAPGDIAKLLEDAFQSEWLAEALGADIAGKADGNPFFALEIIHGLQDGDLLSRGRDGAWEATGTLPDVKVPSSVLDLVHARMHGLDARERELLDAAACTGFKFDPTQVAEALGEPVIPTLQRFAHLETKHRLIRSAGRHCAFDHHQVHEALYGALPRLLREAYHAAIGDALRARLADRELDPSSLDGAHSAELAEHYLKGGKGKRALPYLEPALEYMGKMYLNDRAIAIAELALEVPLLLAGSQRGRVLLKVNERLQVLGRRGRQGAVLREIAELAESAGDTPLIARVESALGDLCFSVGRIEEAGEHHQRHLELARAARDRRGETQAIGNLGAVSGQLNRLGESLDRCHRHLALAREIENRYEEAKALGNIGATLGMLGRHEEAIEYTEQELSMAQEVGDREGETIFLCNLGTSLLSLGRNREVRDCYERALAIARESGDRWSEALATSELGKWWRYHGRHEKARALHERSLRIARETGNRLAEGGARYELGVIAHAHASGGEAGARAHYESALVLLRETGYQRLQASTLLGLGTLSKDGERLEESRRELEEALSLGQALEDWGTAVHAQCELAALPGGDAGVALRFFEEHEEQLEPAESLRALFQLWEVGHDLRHLERAKALLDKLVDEAPEEVRESMISEVALRRHVMEAWNEVEAAEETQS